MTVVYSKDNCMQCKMTKKFLKEHDIDFVEKNTSHNTDYRDEVIELGYQSLPLIKTPDEELFTGFQPERLKQLVD